MGQAQRRAEALAQASVCTQITGKEDWSPRSRRTCSLARGTLLFTQTNICLERFNTSFTPGGGGSPTCPDDDRGRFFLKSNLNSHLVFPPPPTDNSSPPQLPPARGASSQALFLHTTCPFPSRPLLRAPHLSSLLRNSRNSHLPLRVDLAASSPDFPARGRRARERRARGGAEAAGGDPGESLLSPRAPAQPLPSLPGLGLSWARQEPPSSL